MSEEHVSARYRTERVAKIDDALTEIHETFKAEPPALLHHYTSVDGLRGIISCGELWASDVRFLNDSSELNHGLELAKSIVESLKSEVPAETYDLVRVALVSAMALQSSNPVYTFSLSEEPDQLSQWRAYCQAGGWSVAFESSALPAQLQAKHPSSLRLIPVTYDRKTQDQRLEKVIRRFCELAFKPDNDGEWAWLVTIFMTNLLELCLALKHEGFQEEKEWRLVGVGEMSKRTSEYRNLHGRLVPYNVFTRQGPTGSLLPIAGVTCGPTPHPTLQRDATQRLLKQSGYQVDLQQSKIPFRTT